MAIVPKEVLGIELSSARQCEISLVLAKNVQSILEEIDIDLWVLFAVVLGVTASSLSKVESMLDPSGSSCWIRFPF